MNANEVSLKKLFTYTSSVYDIDGNFKGVNRKNFRAKTKASTVAKSIFSSIMCGYGSINELINVNKHKSTRLNTLYRKCEYVPKMHGLRDCIMDTNYKQIEEMNHSVVKKLKENKVFRNNKVDGLTVMAWDGVDLNETKKNIVGLPEKEYEEEIRKYIKYLFAMNVGPNANILANAKILVETGKTITKRGKERAKAIGETKLFEEMWEETENLTGRQIDVHVFDALYLNQSVMNLVNEAGKKFVIRLKNEKLNIYKDAEGLFSKREADEKYEIIEQISTKKIKYSREAKKKDKVKKKRRLEKRELSEEKLGESRVIEVRSQEKKNSTVKIIESEKVIIRKEVWYDEFEIAGYKGKVRVIKSKEISIKNGKEAVQEIYVVTNMLEHSKETILKIMHLRWNIENCGFRTLKQRYNLEHIFIGEMNSINYIVQMIILAFNLFELYTKIRLKERIIATWEIITRIVEQQYQNDKELCLHFSNSG